MIEFIISLAILIIFSIIDPVTHRKFSRNASLVFHIIGISAILISLGFLVISEFKFTFMVYLGSILILASGIIIILTYIQIKKHFLMAKGIVKIGLYKKIRHPMYSGIILFFIGLIIAVPSFYVLVYSLISILLMIYQAYEEEKFLEKKFPDYLKYKKETGMIFPKF